MQHIKYPKMVSVHHTKEIEAIKTFVKNTPDVGTWCVTEKMHGSNISFQFDRKTKQIRIASRNQFCSDNFFGVGEIYKDIKEELESFFLYFHRIIQPEDADTFCLFGEIIGNGIQKGVFYTGKREWVMFDVFLVRDGRVTVSLPAFDVSERFLVAPPLFTGTLDECLAYPNEFESVVPKLLGHNEERPDNKCEGVVIRPVRAFEPFILVDNVPIFLSIKNKNDRFLEISHKTREKKTVEIDEEIVKTVKELVNDNRFDSARSKLGEFESHKQIGDFIKHISSDILEDIGDQDRVFTKTLSIEVANFLKQKLSSKS